MYLHCSRRTTFGLFLAACIATIPACTGGDATGPGPFRPALDQEPICGTQSNPCLIEGIYVVASPPGSPNPWTPCTSLKGGCFPQNDPLKPIVWGTGYAGGGWSPLNPKGTGAEGAARPLTSAQRADIQFAIKRIRCPALAKHLLARLAVTSNSIWGAEFSLPDEYGQYAPSSETLFISLNKHWYYDPNRDVYAGVKDIAELEDTLVHEGGHDWFGPGLTPDSIPTNINTVTHTCD